MTNITMLCANRPRLLKQALDSIGDLSNATVTIRSAGINEEVDGYAWAWARFKRQAYFKEFGNRLGTGPARNEVIKKSEESFGRGGHLYLSDDDVYFLPRRNWVRTLCCAVESAWDDGYRVIGAYNHPFHRPISTFPVTKGSYVLFNVHEVYALATQSMMMRWSVWDEFGPFCDTPAGKVCQSEDVDFCNRIRAAGYKVGVISPALLVNTGITNSFGEKIVGWEMVKAEAPEGVLVE
jgi:GT2 family glycosyltransferase